MTLAHRLHTALVALLAGATLLAGQPAAPTEREVTVTWDDAYAPQPALDWPYYDRVWWSTRTLDVCDRTGSSLWTVAAGRTRLNDTQTGDYYLRSGCPSSGNVVTVRIKDLPSGVVGRAYRVQTVETHRVIRCTVYLDPSNRYRTWTKRRSTVMHELMHCLGANHTPSGYYALMAPGSSSWRTTTPTYRDAYTLRRLTDQWRAHQ